LTTSNRPHGRAKYVVEKCKCEVCRTDARAYERNRRRQRAYGRAAYVDAEPARQHVRALQAAGIGWKRVAKLAGLDHSVLFKLLYGDQKRFGRPSKRIRPATEAKILSVRADLDNFGSKALVDATGARRRLQALVAIGWSQSKLGARLGITPNNFTATMKYDRLRVDTVRAVRALYEELWDKPPIATTHREKIAFSRSVRTAAQRGWAPPMAWDDDTIDDPAAQPEGIDTQKRRGKLPPPEELLYLAETETPHAIARRFGLSVAYVEKHLTRARTAAA
jgi:DNA-binding CsgD family transcriptional regulator